MKQYPTLSRWLSVGITVAVFGLVGAIAAWSGRSPSGAGRLSAAQIQAALARAWPQFGGDLRRNMVNITDKNVPTEWNVEEGQQKHIKWVAALGSRAYGGPVVAGGKIY